LADVINFVEGSGEFLQRPIAEGFPDGFPVEADDFGAGGRPIEVHADDERAFEGVGGGDTVLGECVDQGGFPGFEPANDGDPGWPGDHFPEFFGGFHKLRSALFQGVDGLPEEDCEVADCLFVIRVHDECGGAG